MRKETETEGGLVSVESGCHWGSERKRERHGRWKIRGTGRDGEPERRREGGRDSGAGSQRGSMMARVSVHECGQENNSEQHSCPTRLNSLLQLHVRSPLHPRLRQSIPSRHSSARHLRKSSGCIFHFLRDSGNAAASSNRPRYVAISLSRVHHSSMQPFLVPSRVCSRESHS